MMGVALSFRNAPGVGGAPMSWSLHTGSTHSERMEKQTQLLQYVNGPYCCAKNGRASLGFLLLLPAPTRQSLTRHQNIH